MYSLLRILLYLNPLKLFFQNGQRRNLRLLGVLIAAGAAAFPALMPGWLAPIVEKATGTAIPTAERQDGGSQPPIAFPQQPPPPSRRQADGSSGPGRGELFAAYADLRLRPNQVRRLPDSPAPATTPPGNVRWLRIDRAVDGDTLSIGGETVRLIGIDAPESHENDHLFRELRRMKANDRARDMVWLGQESARFLKQAEGRRCWLEYDEEPRDQYGRLLAYIHLDNGTILNEAILYQGYAKVYLGGKFRYTKRYIQLQDEAMARRNGLWGAR